MRKGSGEHPRSPTTGKLGVRGWASERVLLFFSAPRFLVLDDDALVAFESEPASAKAGRVAEHQQRSEAELWRMATAGLRLARGMGHAALVVTAKGGDGSECSRALAFATDAELARWWAALSAASELRVERFYSVGRVLGEGAFSQVRLAVDRRSGAERAVKILSKARRGSSDSSSTKQLRVLQRREVELMRALQHPNIVQVVDIFDGPKRVYIVMELVRGGTLREYLASQPELYEHEVAHIMRQVLSAVGYLHERGVVHRDLKLENVLLTARSWPADAKIADFGLAGLLSDDDHSVLTSLVGTPYYMAPELLQALASVDDESAQRNKTSSASAADYNEAVDLWACGVMLYALLTGAFPFEGASPAKLLRAIIASADSAPVSLPENTMRALAGSGEQAQSLVRALLQREPKKRLSVSAALCHPWLLQSAPSEEKQGLKLQRSRLLELLPQSRNNALESQQQQQQQPTLTEHGKENSLGALIARVRALSTEDGVRGEQRGSKRLFRASVTSVMAVNRLQSVMVRERRKKLRRLFYSAMAANKLVSISHEAAKPNLSAPASLPGTER